MYLKQDGAISTVNDKPLEDQFIFFGSNISFSENYVNISIQMASSQYYYMVVALGEKSKLHKDAECYFEQILVAVLHKIVAVRFLASHHTNYSNKTNMLSNSWE